MRASAMMVNLLFLPAEFAAEKRVPWSGLQMGCSVSATMDLPSKKYPVQLPVSPTTAGQVKLNSFT